MALKKEPKVIGKERKNGWGGKRIGAGRKAARWRKGAPHRERLRFNGWTGLHVTIVVQKGLPDLREKKAFSIAVNAFLARKERKDFRIIAWTVQRNHIHLLVEATSTDVLTRTIQGLLVSLARRWNRLWKRKGCVFLGRFFAREVKNASDGRKLLAYVLKNHKRHGRSGGFDLWSASLWMDVWMERDLWKKERVRWKIAEYAVPVSSPRTQYLKFAAHPGGVSIFDQPKGYYRDEFLSSRKVDSVIA